MRTKGSPNKARHNQPGQMKTVIVKFRASEEWVNVFDKVTRVGWSFSGKTRSQILRSLVMRSLIHTVNPEFVELVKDQEDIT